MDKRKLLEERQRKWQEQKSNDETLLKCQQETRTCAVDSKDVKTRTLAHRSDFGEAQNGFLNRLTDKLSDRIRDEIKREFRETSLLNADENKAREALGDKMDSYLQAELSNYTCRICYELMRSPLHIPILLFPCGHTFCRLCMEKSTSHAKIQLCPYCRTPISSSAVNQSLKDLVDQYLSQSQQLQKRGILDMQSLDEIFTSSGSLKDGSIGVSHAVTPTVGDSKAMMHFKSRLKSCEMRIQILTNELEEAKNVLKSAEKKLTTIESTHGVLHHERKCVVEKMQQLIEERELIDEHIADQLAKLDEAKKVREQCLAKERLLKDTIQEIQQEADKLAVLAGSKSNT